MNSVLENYFAVRQERDMLYQANKIAGYVQKNNFITDSSVSGTFLNEIDEKSTEISSRILVFDRNFMVIADSNKSEVGKTFVIPELLDAMNGSASANLRKDEGTIYASAYVDDETGAKTGAVLIVSSFTEFYGLLDTINHDWLIITALISILVAILNYISSGWFIKPLSSLVETIYRITDGNLSERFKVKGNDEIAVLGTAVNKMTDKLEQEDSSRSEFVSNVSHELKTPLSSIKVLSESILLQDGAPEEMYREFLQDINSEVDRMTNMINDLLSLVKLDSREVGLNLAETNLRKMLISIMKMLYPLAGEKDIELVLEADREVIILADETKLSLAVSNLIDNAIKYTPEGGVVKVTLENDSQNAYIAVIDSGIGISEEEQAKIFNRFYRVDKTRDRETGGTGLGLAITHQTVLNHGGSVKVISKEGSGATFIVRLPFDNREV